MRKTKIRGCVVLLLLFVMLLHTSVVSAAAAAGSDNTAPSVPAGLKITNRTFTSITLSWTAASDNIAVKGYHVYKDGKKVNSVVKTGCTVSTLIPGKGYEFTVTAYDAAGNFSSPSKKITAATLSDITAPSVPEGLKAAAVAETEVSLAWYPSFDNVKVKSYEIFLDGVKKTGTSKTSYTCKDLLPGKSYIFTVKALDIAGNYSGFTKSLKIETLKDLKAPSAPAGLKIKSVKGTAITLEWNGSTDNVKVKGYKIYRNGVEVETANGSSRSVRALKSTIINIFYVKAYDLAGNISQASNSVMVLMQ